MRNRKNNWNNTLNTYDELQQMDMREMITGKDLFLSHNQSGNQDLLRSCSISRTEEEFRIPDMLIEPLDMEEGSVYQNEFIGVEEAIEEGLGRASHADSYDDITNPEFIQPTVVSKTEESSFGEWSLKLGEHKRYAACDSLSSNAKVDLLGISNYKVRTIENICQKSVHSTEWHVKSGSGVLDIELQFQGIPDQFIGFREFFIRVVIFRKHAEFRHFAVNTICPKHLKEDPKHPMHVLQALPGSDQPYFYTNSNAQHRKSISFPCDPPVTGNISKGLQMRFMCNASCNTCSDVAFKNKEKAQDLLLVFTLEVQPVGRLPSVLARTSVPIWPKAAVAPRDLEKGARR
eukprot:GFUD01021537.1.p1 GENE.GFUD01021537.1~~GFUD01021537.1.p1  ORF type:complete len:362 (+),score=43.01 GFUD01021537.1:50-1087(+)